MTRLSDVFSSPAQIANFDHNKNAAREMITHAAEIYQRACAKHGNADVALVYLAEVLKANLDVEELSIALSSMIAQQAGGQP